MQIRRSATSRSTAPSNTSSSSTSLRSSSSSSSSPTSNAETQKIEPTLYNEVAIRLNENSLEQCRTSVSALAGCVAGILGLTSYKGFLFYGLSMLFLSFLIYLHIRKEYRTFFANPKHIFLNGFFNGLLTYVLFWTFVYGMVHLY